MLCKSYENPALCTYISLQTPQMYAHSCITTFLLCNVSLDGAASTEADRKVVRSVSEREHILDCRLDDVNSSILCQNSAINKHNFEKRSMRKGYFEPASIPCAGMRACSCMNVLVYVHIRTNRDVAPRTTDK